MTTHHDTTIEQATHALLGLIADHPGTYGRLRSARTIAGYPTPTNPQTTGASTRPYTATAIDWPLRETVALIDTLIDNGLIAQTTGPRPTLALTRAGHHALNALDALD